MILSILSSDSRISIAFFLASRTGIPDKDDPNSVIFPSKSIAWKGDNPNSLKTATSF